MTSVQSDPAQSLPQSPAVLPGPESSLSIGISMTLAEINRDEWWDK